LSSSYGRCLPRNPRIYTRCDEGDARSTHPADRNVRSRSSGAATGYAASAERLSIAMTALSIRRSAAGPPRFDAARRAAVHEEAHPRARGAKREEDDPHATTRLN
jgi:hypothetical protein